jgi:hypothetical protein
MFDTALTDFSLALIMLYVIAMFDSWQMDLSELLYLNKANQSARLLAMTRNCNS